MKEEEILEFGNLGLFLISSFCVWVGNLWKACPCSFSLGYIICVYSMATKVERKSANRAERSVYISDEASSTVVCTFYLEGRCTKKFCKFFHPPKPMKPHTLKQKPLVWKRDGTSSGKRYACSPTQQINAAPKVNTAQKRNFTQEINAALKVTQKRNFTQKIDAAQEGNTEQERSFTQKIDAAQEGNTAQKRSFTQKVDAAQKSNTAQESNFPRKSSPPQINNAGHKTQDKVCKFWVEGNCAKGDQCLYMHKWFCGEGLSAVANLLGHNKAITGIALPEGSTKLYSAGKDGTVRVWDCHTGQCDSVFNLDGEVGSLISEGPWLFVGLQNLVKARHMPANAEFNLTGPVGQVHALVVGNEMLFAGAQDGVISMWKLCMGTNNHSATLKGHTGAVVCLTVGGNRLYSGSVDHSIRVWDLDTLQCVNTLNGHSGAVMSLICWDQFLISCSLDCTIKVWAAAKGGNLEVTYSKTEEDGLLALSRTTDAENKPILLCSCNDNSVRLHELPSFTEKGRLFAKEEVRTLEVGPGGLFFSGDATGLLSVWKWIGRVVESS